MFLNITARSFQRQSTLTKLVTDWSVFVHVLLFHWACQPALSPKSHFPHKKKSPFSVQSMPWPVSNLSLAASTVLWILVFALCSVAEVVRRHEGPLPKSLDSDENFKPKHKLSCRNL